MCQNGDVGPVGAIPVGVRVACAIRLAAAICARLVYEVWIGGSLLRPASCISAVANTNSSGQWKRPRVSEKNLGIEVVVHEVAEMRSV